MGKESEEYLALTSTMTMAALSLAVLFFQDAPADPSAAPAAAPVAAHSSAIADMLHNSGPMAITRAGISRGRARLAGQDHAPRQAFAPYGRFELLV